VDVPLSSAPVESKSLKRKRVEDEDEDLYANTKSQDKKVRSNGENANGTSIQFANRAEGPKEDENEWLIFLVSQDGALQIRRLSTLDVVFQCKEFASLPQILSNSLLESEGTMRNASIIEEVLVANLGDTYVEPHLLVRTELNDIFIYKPFQYANTKSSRTSLGFTKIANPRMTREPIDEPQNEDDDLSLGPNRMVALPANSGYATVFVCGSYPGFILKTAQSLAKFHKLTGESVRSICQFNVNNGVQDGFLYYDSQVHRKSTSLTSGGHKDISTSC
jgi:cleavage and polyadenylation specificity factor subunit 1